MIVRQKIVLDAEFKQDILDALEQDKYEVTEVENNNNLVHIDMKVSGIVRTKNHGAVEFSFEASKRRNS
jgi:hypothetical protein